MRGIKIIVGTPSFNEEESISYVTKKIDKGLFKFFPDYKNLIVDVDQSTDNTKNVFLKTKTITPKKYFYVGSIGKGKNLLKLFKYALEAGAEYVCTIDSDIRSIQENWIKKLLLPLITKKVDLVCPLYVRNRYEANTTNQFCYPIISSFFNYEIRQPIAGDFAMNRAVIKFILSQKRISEVEKYGIDSFLIMNVAGYGFRIKEVYLGKKIHNPSFGKMVPMFQQIAAVTFFTMSRYKKKFHEKKQERYSEYLSEERSGIHNRSKKPSKKAIIERKKYALSQLKLLLKASDKSIRPLSKDFVKNLVKNPEIDKDLWVEILYKFTLYVINHKITPKAATQLSQLVTPLYLLRVLTYYTEIEKLSPTEIENIILYQKNKLKSKLQNLEKGTLAPTKI